MKDTVVLPKYFLVNVIIFIASLSLAVVTGIRFFTVEEVNAQSIIIFIVATFLSIPLGNILHEGGHLLFGTCCGMKVKMDKQPFLKSLFYSNSCQVVPRRDAFVKGKFVITTFGGLFINAICVVFGVLALLIEGMPAIVATIAPWSLYLLLVNGLPLEYQSGKTDMLVALEVITNDDSGRVLINILRVQAQANKKGLENIEEDLLFNLPQLPEDNVYFIILTYLRYKYYLARGEQAQSQKYYARLAEIIEYLPDGYIQNSD